MDVFEAMTGDRESARRHYINCERLRLAYQVQQTKAEAELLDARTRNRPMEMALQRARIIGWLVGVAIVSAAGATAAVIILR